MMSWESTLAIQQLVYREREARDRGWWEEMRNTFSPDATISLSWYQGDAEGFVDGSMRMARGGSTSSHKLGPVVVRVRGSRAIATLSATIEARLKVSGVEADLMSDTRLLYRAAMQGDGNWRLSSLTCMYEKDRIIPAVPGMELKISPAELHRYRPSYRYLSYVLESKGFPVDRDLVGDDRPEGISELYREAFKWLSDGEK